MKNTQNVDTENIYYDGDLTLSSGSIIIKNGKSLYVNGNLKLTNTADLYVNDGCTLTINGDLIVDFVSDDDGVDIDAGSYANIYVNGNIDYRGVTPHGSIDYKIKGKQGPCYNDEGEMHHSTSDTRRKLFGIFMVNGDVLFKNASGNADDSKSGSFSNPCINATFHVDGVFDMRQLSALSIYDYCRPTFIFARTLKQPTVGIYDSLNNSGYQGQHTTKEWMNYFGFVFAIVEDAVNFTPTNSDKTEANFAAINFLTPYRNAVASLEQAGVVGHNGSLTDNWIGKDIFTSRYTVEMVNGWGLPSILKSGFKQIIEAATNDANAFTRADEVTGNQDLTR